MSKKEKAKRSSQVAIPGSELISFVDEEGPDALAKLQVHLSLESPFEPSDPEYDAIVKASAASYSGFAAKDATERVYATMAVALQNAVMASLQRAAHTDNALVRAEELKIATKMAGAVVGVLEASDRHRGRAKPSVAVGQVTVESGGQAIVGNVSTEAPKRAKDYSNGS